MCPERAVHEAVRRKLKVQWRPQEAGNMEHLLRKTTSSQPKGEVRDEGWGTQAPWNLYLYITCPSARHGTIDYNDCPGGCQSYLVQFHSRCLFLLFAMGIFILCACMLEVFFIRTHCYESRRGPWTWTLQQCYDLVTLIWIKYILHYKLNIMQGMVQKALAHI